MKWFKKITLLVLRWGKWPFRAFVFYFILCLPSTLFQHQYSKVVLDKNGYLLEARIASDGQWRFPTIEEVPSKFEACILRFEDQHFNLHPGVNPVAIARAMYLNIKHKEVVSGGSTITMQTVRLMRKNKSRTIWEKITEMIWALRLDLEYSKSSILRMYSTHAPFGGNVVGLETASWRYFNRAPSDLSWAESAMLAVLPNAPGLIHLNKNREKLRAKRNRLLKDMYVDGIISEADYNNASLEPLPNPINRLPHHAYHLVNRFKSGGRIKSTIDFEMQKKINSIAENYHHDMKRMNINNLSIILIDVENQEVAAYVGNIHDNNNAHAGKVDMLQSVRSSGSILKPLLYAKAIDEGLIAPRQLIPDYPMSFSGYRPENYNPEFDGLVPASQALFRSLNIPATWLLREYGQAKFKYDLKNMGLTSVNRAADNYGLSLILGGAEVNLLELTNAYASLSAQLQNDTLSSYELFATKNHDKTICASQISMESGSVYSILNALTNTYRPETEAYWKSFSSGSKIAWKTGTSFGNRDAWAVGVTKKYAIGVWVGNSEGEGIAELTGLNTAAPLLFQVFDVLPKCDWFFKPYGMTRQLICAKSGMKANNHCPSSYESELPVASKKTEKCQYHKAYFLDEARSERVYRQCTNGAIKKDTFFVVPPIVAYYYKRRHPDFKEVPKWSDACISSSNNIDILYPLNDGRISLPRSQEEKKGITAKAFIGKRSALLYWEFNGVFLGTTETIHEMVILPKIGKNELVITDEDGFSKRRTFEVS